METLLPALIAVLLSEIGSKTQGFALRLAGVGRAAMALCALLLTSIVGYAVAAVGGYYISQMIAFEARQLLFGVALLAAGLPMLFSLPAPPLPPDPPSFVRTAFGFARTQFGDSAQFIVFALAAKVGGLSSGLAVLGALFGLSGAIGIATAAGADWPKDKKLRTVRAVAGALLAVSGFLIAIRALGLVATG